MKPSCWTFWCLFQQSCGNIPTRIPFQFLCINLKPDFENIWMGPFCRFDVVQFSIGLDMVTKFEPTLSGAEVMKVRQFEWFHFSVGFKRVSSPRVIKSTLS